MGDLCTIHGAPISFFSPYDCGLTEPAFNSAMAPPVNNPYCHAGKQTLYTYRKAGIAALKSISIAFPLSSHIMNDLYVLLHNSNQWQHETYLHHGVVINNKKTGHLGMFLLR
jgi:hypothetical protein